MKIGFFLLHYPVFSETFVSKEILNLQRLKVNGVIVCEKATPQEPIHPHINDIKFPVIEIFPKILGKNFLNILSAHLFWITKNPIGYLKSIYIFLHFLSFHHLRVFIKTPLLAQQLVIYNLELIYVHEIDSPCLYGLVCSRLLNIPCGIIFHTQYLFAQTKFLKPKIKFASFTIFQSQYSRNRAGNPPYSHVVFTPGIDTQYFSPKINFNRYIKILSVGRLVEAKNFLNLIKAIKILLPIQPTILLTIVGDGPLKDSFQKFIIRYQLQKNVRLLGAIPHNRKLVNLFHQHQYFILPSIIDSQGVHDMHPNVVKEAMSCGLLTITSDLGGIREIINDRQNGFLIHFPTPLNIAKKIVEVHQFKNKKNISLTARKTILISHDQAIVSRQLKNIFNQFA